MEAFLAVLRGSDNGGWTGCVRLATRVPLPEVRTMKIGVEHERDAADRDGFIKRVPPAHSTNGRGLTVSGVNARLRSLHT